MSKPKMKSVVVARLQNVKDFSNYQKLELINRLINKKHVLKIVESYEEFGTAGSEVIIIETKAWGQKEYYIADGQHRIEASILTALGINVTIVRLLEDTPFNVTKYIATLNNTALSWNNNNYTKSYASIGIYEYQVFEEIMRKFKLLTNDLQYIFLGGASVKQVKEYKSGRMTFDNEEKSFKMLNALMKCRSRVPNYTFVRRSLYKLFLLTDDYDFVANAIIDSRIKEYSSNEAMFYDQIVNVYRRAKANAKQIIA
jgi:hypothetical protein